MTSPADEVDEFIGYEIPVEFSEKGETGERNENTTPTFNLDALEIDDGQQTRFEMMEIHITLYALSGILYHKKKPGEKRRKRAERWRRIKSSKTSITTNDAITTSGASTQEGTALSTISGSCESDLIGFEINPLLAPTTAVVSSTRHNPTSDRPMETFVPSLPLHRLSRGNVPALRYSARWSTESHSSPEDTEEDSPSFKILRLMNQQQFIPASRIGELSTYEHEQIDLRVFVGRGKEMIPIGVVSFVVTGDEETETILNLPVKKPADGSVLFERHFKQSKRKKGPQDAFESDPDHAFSLSSNATLRLGVRALPQRSFIEAEERAALAREKDEKVFESVLEKILDTELLETLNEENSLIQKIVQGQKEKIEEQEKEKVREVLQQGFEQQSLQQVKQTPAPTPMAAVQPNLFCTFSFFQSNVCPPGSNDQDPAIPQQVVAINRKKVVDPEAGENMTIPLTLVSSVSESVTTEGGHSNTRFRNEQANV